jgi:hopanoid biosynthesis associated RND transporter like protein HpnN
MIAISRTGRLLRRLVRVSCRRPYVTVTLSLLLALLGIVATVQGLRFKTSGRDVLPPDAGYVQRYAEYARDFGELEDIVVVVEARTFEAAKAYASRLVQELRGSPLKFGRASYRIDPQRFEGRQLLYLSSEKLREIRAKIFDHQEFMESFAADPSLAQLLDGVNTQFAQAFMNNVFDLGLDDKSPADTRFLQVLLEQIDQRLDRPTRYRSPWGTLFSFGREAEADAGYFLSDDKSLLFVLVETPKGDTGSFVGDHAAITTVRDAVERLRVVFPNVQAGVTGAPVLSNDEMSAALEDSKVATILSFALTLGLIWLSFLRVGKPTLMLGVLAVSIAWSMGVVTLFVGHLTIFSVMFISIVVGVGIDYGIYFLFRYEEEIFLGRNLREALERTAARAGPAILLGALTAAATFYVLMLTDFRGIKEFGFIAGSAIMLSWLSMMTLFPAVLVLVDSHHAERPRNQKPPAHQLERIRVPLLDRLTGYPVTVLAAAVVVTVGCVFALPWVGFDYNLLHLQAKGTESVAWEKRILATTGRSGFNALASATSLEELGKKQQAFERLPSVSEVNSVLRLIPDEQPQKIQIIKSFAPLVAPVRVNRSSPVDLDRLTQSVRDLNRRFDIAAAEGGDRLPDDIRRLREQSGRLLTRLAGADREVAEPALTHLQAQLYRDFVDKFYMLQRNLRPRPVTLADVPDEMHRKFIGASGKFLIQIHPKVDIWEREGAAQFVRELRTVDADVTGSPVITYEAIRLMERAYLQGTVYAFVLVGALTFWMLRRVRETLLSLLPLIIGLIWTIGLMWLFDLKFTLANVWGLPLIIGTSAEFGLNVVMNYLEGREHDGPLVARSTVMAVVLNGLTTIVGFGSLMISRHQGIYGLGLLLTVGATCALIAALVVLPVVLRLMPRPVAHPAEAVPQPSTAA